MLVGMVRGAFYLICEMIALDVTRKLADNPSMDMWQEIADSWQRLCHFFALLPSFDLVRGSLGYLWERLFFWRQSHAPEMSRLAKLAFRAKVGDFLYLLAGEKV